MKHIPILLAIAFSSLTALVACSKKEPVTGQELEVMRATAKTNALWNAEQYRAGNPRLEGMQLIAHTDSTISPDCPQGDGWATINAVFKNPDTGGIEKVELLCSTYSESMGCYRRADLQQNKKLASTDGTCADPRVTGYPLTKIAK